VVACRACGAATSANEKACSACGASVSDPVASARKGKSLWLGMGAAVAVYALLSIGVYLAWSRSAALPELDGAASESMKTALAEQLPPFVRLDSLSLDAVRLDESGPSPAYTITFSGTAVLTLDVYRQSRAENDVVFLAREGVEGTPIPLTGTARVSRAQDGWDSVVSFSPRPLSEGLPIAAFRDYTTIVEGSPEEAAYLESRDRAIEEARQEEIRRREAASAEARQRAREEEEERRRQAERLAAEVRARRLLAQQAEAAAAEEARLEAERQRQAARDEEARRAEELRRQQTQPGTSTPPAVLAGGRVPKGTKVDVRISTGLRTDLVAVEDLFSAETVADIVVRGQVVVPAGATVRGVVASVQPATRTRRRAKLDLRFDRLSVGSRSFPMRARAELSGPGFGRDGIRAGVGAGIGAVIGGLLGGGKGAVVGGAVGSGGAVAATEGQELDLPAGSSIRIEFDAPLDLQ